MPIKDPVARRKFNREWIAKRRREFFKNKKCVDCGSQTHLELDHEDPKQKISHRIWSWTEKRRLAEAKKCTIRCRKCHTKRHAEERMQHGTRRRWGAGCRCLICSTKGKAALAAASARWRANAKKRQQV